MAQRGLAVRLDEEAIEGDPAVTTAPSSTPARLRSYLADLPVYKPGRTIPGAAKLASNEVAFPTLPRVAAAITGAVGGLDLSKGIHRYPDNGALALTAALAKACDTTEDRIAAGGGSVALCHQLAQIAAGEGDEVLFGWRSFEIYPIASRIVGATPVMVPLTRGHALDLEEMAAAVTPRTRLVFLCTPNNPTGTVLDADAVERFLAQVPGDVLVVVDEAYQEFDVDPTTPDGLALSLRYPNVVALRTLSKAYGLAGLRVGYAVGAPDIMSALKKVAVPFVLNTLAQAAAITALGCVDELRPRWQQVVQERGRVTDALRQAGFEVPTSQGNFVWLPLKDRSAAFSAHCEQHRVVVRPFSDAVGGVRISIGAPEENDMLLAAAASWTG